MSDIHPMETLWREHGLPEWFLGNGGTNTKLYALYDSIRALPRPRAITPREQYLNEVADWAGPKFSGGTCSGGE